MSEDVKESCNDMFITKIDVSDPKIKLPRGDGEGPIEFMATAEGYVMCRRPGRMPWVEALNKWVSRPLETDIADLRKRYKAAFDPPDPASLKPLDAHFADPNLPQPDYARSRSANVQWPASYEWPPVSYGEHG